MYTRNGNGCICRNTESVNWSSKTLNTTAVTIAITTTATTTASAITCTTAYF